MGTMGRSELLRLSKLLGEKAVVAVLLLAAAGLAAADWMNTGPYGGSVHVLALNPQSPTILYAGTAEGGFQEHRRGRKLEPHERWANVWKL